MRGHVIVLICLTACASRDAHLASAVTDTLPGGIVRVTSSGPTAWTDTNGWKLAELPAIQPAEGSQGELISPSSIAVDDQGRLYVADEKPTDIKVFDSTGALVRTIGREGDGPGEFRSAYIAIRGNRLLAHDPAAQRTTLFDTSGALIRSFHSVGRYFAPVALDAAGRAVLPLIFMMSEAERDAAPKRAFYVARFDTLGNLLDTLSVPQLTEEHSWLVKEGAANVFGMGVPFAPSTVSGFGRDSGLIYGASTDFAIMRAEGGRDTTFIMRRTWTAPAIPDSVRTDTVDHLVKAYANGRVDEVSLRNAFHAADIPTTGPSFSRLFVDDKGNTWAQQALGADSTRFDVFGPDGSWLGPVVVPAGMSPYGPFVIHGGVVYLATEDGDGFPEVRRWAIQGGQGEQGEQGGQGEQERR
jgi:hypothetical protein